MKVHGNKYWYLWIQGFVIIYFFLYLFPFPFNVLPGIAQISGGIIKGFWDYCVVWTGDHILQMDSPISVQTNGSGDRTYNYVQMLVQFSLAIMFSPLYVFGRINSLQRERIYFYFITYIRYALAFAMLSYGFHKVIKLQFPSPSLEILLQPLGDLSPMRLAWTFMGFSTTYTFFAGLCEVIGGTLLLFRRTATVGAIVTGAVMLNVVMLNFSYDIPVKLYSSHLLLISMIIFAYDGKRYWKFFVTNELVEPANYRQPVYTENTRKGFAVIKGLFISYFLVSSFWGNWKMRTVYGTKRPQSYLYGIYTVDTFRQNGMVLPPQNNEYTRWKSMVFDYPDNTIIEFMNGEFKRYTTEIDTLNYLFTSSNFGDTTSRYSLQYERLEKDKISFEGYWRGDTLEIIATRKDPGSFQLNRRGFHWINEYPYNR